MAMTSRRQRSTTTLSRFVRSMNTVRTSIRCMDDYRLLTTSDTVDMLTRNVGGGFTKFCSFVQSMFLSIHLYSLL